MIEINLYRCRIGSFYQAVRNQKIKFRKFENQCSESLKSGKLTLTTMQSILKMILLLFISYPCFSTTVTLPLMSALAQTGTWTPDMLSCWMLPTTAYPRGCSVLGGQIAVRKISHNFRPAQQGLQKHTKGKKQSSNFLAKYLYGNRKKGIMNMHLNIRSLTNKIGEIKKVIKEHTPHILGLSECELKKISNQFDESKLKVPGYQILYPKSWTQHGTARVLVYVKNGFEIEQLHELEDERVQSIWFKGGFKNGKKLYFCHGYREHTSSLGNTLSAQRSNLELFLCQWETAVEHNSPAVPNEVHISGDMNLDCLNGRWLDSTYHLLSLSRMVQDTCNAYNLSQLVKEATRLQYNSVQNRTDISCIDHVYTNAKYRCSGVTITSFGNSDHDLISYTRYSKEPPAPARTIRKRSYKNFVEEKYIEDLAQVDWSDGLSCEDLDTATDTFTRKLRYILNVHAPWIVFQQRKFFVPWLTEETKQLMLQRDKFKQEAKEMALRDMGRSVSEDQRLAWEKFKKLRNKINNEKKKEEKNYKASKISEDLECPGKVWKTAKSFMGWKTTGTPSQLEVDGKLETRPSAIAKLMNDFFIGKVQTIRNNLRKAPQNLRECSNLMKEKMCKLSLNHVTIETVRKLLKQLKNSKSTSVDELDSYSVKIAADHIAKPLHHLITLSIMQNRFPTSWKYTKLIPLHKKLDKLDRQNYRPVAILSPLSKILEKVVYLHIYEYFTANKLFHPNLHGYRKNRSTQTALLQMYDRWVRAAAAGQVSGVILIDLSAAFDLVDSDILLQKLKIYGLDDNFLLWIKSYMTERHQAVWIDHVFSECKAHSIGVPQGSNLGPLFFLIYYNDLISTLDCEIDAYADDSTISATGKSVAEIGSRLTENCEKVVTWMCSNQFKLNASKTHLMTVGTGERLAGLAGTVKVSMDGVQLEESIEKSEFLLGCDIQSNLKWSTQVERVLGKLRSRLVGLNNIKYIAPYHTRNTITIGIFNSILVYCLPLYGGCKVADLHSLQVLQNRAAQVVTHSPPRTHRDTMYSKLKWLTVNQLVAYHTLLTVHKIRQTGEPEYLAQFLKNDNRQDRIIIPNTTLTLAKKSFIWRGSETWNSLSLTLRKCTKIGQFKRGAKQWVMDNIPRFSS